MYRSILGRESGLLGSFVRSDDDDPDFSCLLSLPFIKCSLRLLKGFPEYLSGKPFVLDFSCMRSIVGWRRK